MSISRILRWIRRPLRVRYDALASKRDLDNLFVQLSALVDVRDQTGPNVGARKLRGWAISPDALAEVLHELSGRKGPEVVEFGSGASTVAIAASLRRAGSGRLVSYEHDPVYAEQVMQRVRSAGLESLVDLRVVNINSFKHPSGLSFQSYALEKYDDTFDVALVDGPIKGIHGEFARLGPLEWCMQHAKAGSVVFLDDADREGEQRALDVVRSKYKQSTFTEIPAEKGLVRIVKSGPLPLGGNPDPSGE